MRKKKRGKLLAALLALGLFTGMLGACGKDGSGNENLSGPGSGSVSGKTEKEKGRYVEKSIALPGELEGWSVIQMYGREDTLHLFATKDEDGKTLLGEWAYEGGTFTEVTGDWLKTIELPDEQWIDTKLVRGADGVHYLYAGYIAEGEESFRGRLWKETDHGAEEITPEKWKVQNDDWSSYEMVQGLTVLDNGSLAVLSYDFVDILSGQDGSVVESDSNDGVFYDVNVVTDGENIYLCYSDGSNAWIEKRKGGSREGAELIPFPAGDTSEEVVNFGGGGSYFLDVLKDDTLIAAGKDGIFRLPDGKPEGEWEELIPGMETDFSMSGCWCVGFAALENGGIYGLFQTEAEQKLRFYEYDPDAVSEVTQVLKLYTVYENSLLEQAAIMYHKVHPEVLIEIESEYPLYYYEAPDYDAIYKKLNTMLLSDDSPDILSLDHLNMDSYITKGLLENIDDVVKPLEEGGDLLTNIMSPYVREDGKRYVVPLQFGFDLAMGRDIPVESMRTMEALAKFLSQADYSYMGDKTAAELVELFYPYFCDKIVCDKQLDKEALGKYLGYLKEIADNCGVIDQRQENEISYGMWELAAQAKFAVNKATGFTDCMFPMSIVDYIKGDFTAFENSFTPSGQIGICSKGKYKDTARDFLRFALSQEVQDMDYNGGFPVNSHSLEEQAKKDRSNMTAAIMLEADDGGYIDFTSKAYSQETAGRLLDICRSLDTPVKEDVKVQEVLTDCLYGYFKDSQSLEETIGKIEDGLKMYLAE